MSRRAGVLAAFALAAGGCGGASDAGPQTNTIRDFEFRPQSITIDAGTSVTWTNRDEAPHTATAGEGAPAPFDTGRLGAGGSGTVDFTQPGTYRYACAYHPFMTGTIVVE